MKWMAGLILTGTTLAQSLTSTAGKIAFVADNDIRVMNADGSDVKNLTNNGDKRREFSPTWSPDGRRIAFAADGDIFVVDADGSNERQLTKKKGFNQDSSQPVWAPDGKRLAYVCGPMLGADLYVMDADGSNAKNLTNDKDNDRSPVWSPDGTRIAYVTQPAKEMPGGGTDYNTYDLSAINADGSGRRKLTDGEAKEKDPVWSPDSRRLVFTTQGVVSKQGNVTQLANPDLWIMNADGSAPKNLTNNRNKGEDQWPTWSPDGSKIAFEARKDGGPCAVYTMDADGSNVKALTEIKWGSEYHSLRWSPDGKRILFMDSFDKILVMGADGSGLAEVAKGKSPVWSPAR